MRANSRRHFTLLPLCILAACALIFSSCSSDDNDASAIDDSASEAASPDVQDGDSAGGELDRPQLTDEEMTAGLADLAAAAREAADLCELMEAGISPVLMAEPTTEAQAQSMLEFYIVMYEQMAEIVDDEAHSEALAGLAVWFDDNLSGSGQVLESINSDQELAGLATPEVEAAMDYVGAQSLECSPLGSDASASGLNG